jgi:AraC family transcriptional regulator
VRAAEARLGEPDRTLAEIALETGFSDQSHLTRVFRRVTGRTPGAMREALTRRRG